MNSFIDTNENYSINFDISARANKLYPFDDSQTQVYNKAIQNLQLSLSFKQYADKIVSLSKLTYAGDEVYSQAEITNKDMYYTLNSLLDFRILAKDGASPLSMLNIGDEIIESNYCFNPFAAKDLHNSLIQPLIDTLGESKKTKTNAKFKETANAKVLYTYVVPKDEIDKYADLITTVMIVGIDSKIQKDMSPIPYGKWEIKDYHDDKGNRVAIKFDGKAEFANGIKRKIEFLASFNNSYNSYRYEFKATSVNTRNDYYDIKCILKDEKGIIIKSEYKHKTREFQNTETIISNLDINKSKSVTEFIGDFEYKTENKVDDITNTNSYRIEPNIQLINNNNVFSLNGNANLFIKNNNANTVDMTLNLSDVSNMDKAAEYEKALVFGIDSGGIEQNLNSIEESLEPYICNKDFGIQYINMDEWNEVYIKSISNELVQNVAASLLKIMVNQDDMSADILSYGMTDDDWNKFTETLKHIKEKN
ncbi:MAG: hypothetical protein GYA87_06580 [Christensenellaceae bacterium]|nr:hypothetical protein [Christensenellaceae bacterium]